MSLLGTSLDTQFGNVQLGGAPFPEDVDNMYGITESEKQLCSVLLYDDADFTKVITR
jgi:hypothetical protein